MKEHKWEIEEVDGGHLGVGHFWTCKVCGASGGPEWPNKLPPTFKPFLGNGSGLDVPKDCDEAKIVIESFKKGYEFCLSKIPNKIREKHNIK